MVALFGPGALLRPSSVTIFTQPPVAWQAFILGSIAGISTQNDVRLDLSEQETESQTYEVARRPIEGLTSVADHVQKQPIAFTVAGVLSATPLGVLPFVGSLSGSFGSLIRKDISNFQKLKKIADKRERVVVVTEEEGFPDMVIVAIQRTKSGDTGNAIEVVISFEQVTILSPLTVAGLPDADELEFATSGLNDAADPAPPLAGSQSAPLPAGLTDLLGAIP